MKYFFLLLVCLYACSHSNIEKKEMARISKESKPLEDQKSNAMPIPEKKQEEIQEFTEEEEDIQEQKIYAAAHKLHSIFKIKTQGLIFHHKVPIHILLHKKQDNTTEISLSEMISQPGAKPVQKGKELEKHLLSEDITILEKEREFWFDLQGNIDFAEEDKVFDAFDNPPQADIILVPIESRQGKKGMIDIIKKRTQISIYVVEK
ncbi:MAG: hypothetical protein HUU50_17620 [Candidatus Brocadiae bacterium]|nr:hypothetical protein [Candidatus Brocadiia bacterium]